MGQWLIVRPSWPEVYGNLSVHHLGKAKTVEDANVYTISIILFLVVITYHLRQRSCWKLPLLHCVLSILIFPLIIAILAVYFAYRLLAKIIISKTCPGYHSMMEGVDSYWSLEDETSKPIINILAYLELNARNGKKDIRDTIKEIVATRLLTDMKLFKMRCIRQFSAFGYAYWKELSNIRLDDYVRWMDLNIVDDESVMEYVSLRSNSPLPQEGLALWEFLVSREPLIKEGKVLYPVMFRVHHSFSDGVALVNLFLQRITGYENNRGQMTPMEMIRERQRRSSNADLKEIFTRSEGKCLISDGEVNKLNRHGIHWFINILQKLSVIIYASYVTKMTKDLGVDDNMLHGKKLTGIKHLSWASGKDTIAKVKVIKDKLRGRFTDVILCAFSNVFEEYLSTFGNPPEDIVMVVPARLPSEDTKNGMETATNRFTAGLMKLPISADDKFQNIRGNSDKLRNGPQFFVNYWLFRIISSAFPIVQLQNALKSNQATIAISNIPGPESLTNLGEHFVNDLVFWPPNRDTTGVGVSILTYGGKLYLGLIADSGLIPDREDVKYLTKRFVEEIDNIYNCVRAR